MLLICIHSDIVWVWVWVWVERGRCSSDSKETPEMRELVKLACVHSHPPHTHPGVTRRIHSHNSSQFYKHVHTLVFSKVALEMGGYNC
jgi:hypothetical protein